MHRGICDRPVGGAGRIEPTVVIFTPGFSVLMTEPKAQLGQ